MRAHTRIPDTGARAHTISLFVYPAADLAQLFQRGGRWWPLGRSDKFNGRESIEAPRNNNRKKVKRRAGEVLKASSQPGGAASKEPAADVAAYGHATAAGHVSVFRIRYVAGQNQGKDRGD